MSIAWRSARLRKAVEFMVAHARPLVHTLLFSIVICACSVLALFIQGPSAQARAIMPSPPTQVITFRPTDSSGTARGYCWTSSLATLRADAWRCFIGNVIYDPCFSLSSPVTFVICGADPATQKPGIKVMLTRPLPIPETGGGEPSRPWLMRLSNGAVCQFLTGATGIVQNERINYGCSDKSSLIGLPTKGMTWTVQVYRDAKTPVSTAQVRVAWF